MAKVNFRHNKRQKELARKERQSERLARRGERPPEEASAAAVVTGIESDSPANVDNASGVEGVAHESVENQSVESIPPR